MNLEKGDLCLQYQDENAGNILLSELFSNFNPDVLPEERKDGYGITVNRRLRAGPGIKQGDYLIVNGKNYRVVTVTVSQNACFERENYECVGHYSTIRIFK